MTIKEIAKALNLSTTTVSVCLSHREREPGYLIRAEKAEIVRAFAREHGYVPDLTARHLRSNNRIPPVGIVFSQRSGFEKFFPAIRMAMPMLERMEMLDFNRDMVLVVLAELVVELPLWLQVVLVGIQMVLQVLMVQVEQDF